MALLGSTKYTNLPYSVSPIDARSFLFAMPVNHMTSLVPVLKLHWRVCEYYDVYLYHKTMEKL